MLNKFKNDTAVVIISCNRPDFFKKLVDSIDRDAVGKIYVVNAGKPYDDYPSDVEVIQSIRQIPVGIAKNMGMRRAQQDGFTYIFVAEDDIIITNNKVFEEYILTAADSGLWAAQLSYGLHGGIGGGNVKDDGTPKKRATVKYTNKEVDIYLFSFQAFTLIRADMLGDGAYFDERYLNAAEHLAQHQKIFISQKGTPLLYHADIFNSFLYISDQDANHEQSVIRKDPEFSKNFSYSWQLFKETFGYYPQDAPRISQEDVLTALIDIESRFSNKELLNDK